MRGALPHELAFGAVLALTSARLLAAQGLSWLALAFLALLAAAIGVVRLGESRARLVFYAVMVQLLFYVIGFAANALHPIRADALFERADLLLLGFNPNLALERVSLAWITDILSFFYLFSFLPYIALAFVAYYRGERETFTRFCSGLFTVYALGFLGYTLWPAAGPYAAMADRFQGPLAGSSFSIAHHAFVLRGTNGIDAFPSLHCALTGFVLLFDAARAPRRFRLMLAPVGLLWIATVYLRYHYVADVLAGGAAAAAGLWIALRPGSPRAPAAASASPAKP